MPRPKSKADLEKLSEENFNKLMGYVNDLSEVQQRQEFVEGSMNRCIRDVLAHIHHWHLMFVEWYKVGMAGKKPEMPAAGYTWKTTGDLNRKILEQHQKSDLETVKKRLAESYAKVRKIIAKHSNEELFEKKRYAWTGSTSLGAYLISATSSHYDWGLKLIRKGRKGLN